MADLALPHSHQPPKLSNVQQTLVQNPAASPLTPTSPPLNRSPLSHEFGLSPVATSTPPYTPLLPNLAEVSDYYTATGPASPLPAGLPPPFSLSAAPSGLRRHSDRKSPGPQLTIIEGEDYVVASAEAVTYEKRGDDGKFTFGCLITRESMRRDGQWAREKPYMVWRKWDHLVELREALVDELPELERELPKLSKGNLFTISNKATCASRLKELSAFFAALFVIGPRASNAGPVRQLFLRDTPLQRRVEYAQDEDDSGAGSSYHGWREPPEQQMPQSKFDPPARSYHFGSTASRVLRNKRSEPSLYGFVAAEAARASGDAQGGRWSRPVAGKGGGADAAQPPAYGRLGLTERGYPSTLKLSRPTVGNHIRRSPSDLGAYTRQRAAHSPFFRAPSAGAQSPSDPVLQAAPYEAPGQPVHRSSGPASAVFRAAKSLTDLRADNGAAAHTAQEAVPPLPVSNAAMVGVALSSTSPVYPETVRRRLPSQEEATTTSRGARRHPLQTARPPLPPALAPRPAHSRHSPSNSDSSLCSSSGIAGIGCVAGMVDMPSVSTESLTYSDSLGTSLGSSKGLVTPPMATGPLCGAMDVSYGRYFRDELTGKMVINNCVPPPMFFPTPPPPSMPTFTTAGAGQDTIRGRSGSSPRPALGETAQPGPASPRGQAVGSGRPLLETLLAPPDLDAGAFTAEAIAALDHASAAGALDAAAVFATELPVKVRHPEYNILLKVPRHTGLERLRCRIAHKFREGAGLSLSRDGEHEWALQLVGHDRQRLEAPVEMTERRWRDVSGTAAKVVLSVV